MSEKILKALMELFAIIACPDSSGRDRKSVVLSFLSRQLNQELVNEYLKIFEAYYEKHQALNIERGEKRIGADSVKILRICNDINKELAQKQKIIVLVQLFEFVKSNNCDISDQEFAFIQAVSDSFYVPEDEYELIRDFTLNDFDNPPDDKHLLIVDKKNTTQNISNKHLTSEYLSGLIWIAYVPSAGMYFIRYKGSHELYLNGQIIQEDKVFVMNTGTSIRNHHIKPLYFSDIVSVFKEDLELPKIVFEADEISYRFKSGAVGLQRMSFSEESGRMIGIMGSSGAGKSTLLNILNGSVQPTGGRVLINGVDIYEDRVKAKGLIGHVSQDDLLIEELTVYQNLYYNTRLCFDHYTEEQISQTVHNLLSNLGLYEIKDIPVGTPLNKMISGGQRKRLNIALELIREPAILFLDEPTSGLSSKDSENIMDLLKDLTLKGKLVFVVIHQPSSDIFKMFDNLLILDTGGYLIYSGNPVDSITYFKSKVHHANWADAECHVCGNVNPEQIFNIVESLVIDEYGKETRTRKIAPKDWYNFFQESKHKQKKKSISDSLLPEITFKVPSWFKQLQVFITRDVLSKISNMQYMIITLLEAPVLAFILSFIIKFFNVSETSEGGYTFIDNSNLPVYLFMSVIIATFMGLTVSAEEIIKDRKILKREAFLNLSWSGYLVSKLTVMMVISAIQALTFVLIGNSILEVKGMLFKYWIVLFSTWTASNVMGLLISDSFKTVVTIYILIPFLVIPQIILSGVIVKYEKLNPSISSPSKIPVYGEMMTSRWGYEALAVEQFMHNKYDEIFYEVNKKMSIAEYKKNYWLKNLGNKIDYLERNLESNENEAKKAEYMLLLRNELSREIPGIEKIKINTNNEIPIPQISHITPELLTQELIDSTREFFNIINRIYIRIYNKANDNKDEIIRQYEKTNTDKNTFLELKRTYHNDKLTEFVENNNELIRIIEYKGRLYQKIDPVYLDPDHPFIKAHFYAPRKRFLGNYYSTFWVNTIVIWIFSLILFILLYFRILKRLLDLMEHLSSKWKKQT